MFLRAIVATDLGPSSEGIVACVGALGALGVREAVLLHAIDGADGASRAHDEAFRRQVDALETTGLKTFVEAAVDSPPHAITSLARARAADLIVMGIRRGSAAPARSIASETVRMSQMPVLLVPDTVSGGAEEGDSACSRLLSSVLVPTDLSPTAARVCDLVSGLAGVGRLEFLHVVEGTFESLREGREDQARGALGTVAKRARAAAMRDVRTTLAFGVPCEVAAHHASSGLYSLVVVAPRHRVSLDGAFDSVTAAVLQASATPILLVPPLGR